MPDYFRDTAFRSARLTIADWFKIDQKDPKKRLALSFPLLLVGYFISFLDYNVVWRYFSWSNQTLAMIALWAGATYLAKYVSKNASFIAAGRNGQGFSPLLPDFTNTRSMNS